MAGEFLLGTYFVTVAVMLGLAGWMLRLNFGSPVNRVFSLFLVLTSARLLFFVFERFAVRPEMQDYWSVLAEYMYLIIPFVLLYFLVVYLRPRGDLWLRTAIMAGAAVVVVLYLSDHCLSVCPGITEIDQLGPLALFSFGTPFISGVVGATIAYAIRSARTAHHARASALVAASFVLLAIFNAVLSWSGLINVGWGAAMADYVDNAWQGLGYLNFGMALVPGIIGAVLLVLVYRQRGEWTTRGMVFLAALAFSVLSALFVGFAGPSIGVNWSLFVVGLWLLVPPSFIAYALLRHRVIGIDHHVKKAVRSSTIAAFFAAAFFVGSELLENLIDLPGVVLGVAAAGAIALALRPIQMFADRLADKAFPDLRPVVEMTAQEREEFFQEQATLVWSDGIVGTKERMLLNRLQERLGLPPDRADGLEETARRALQKPQKATG